jgi:membrane protein insertase Oxa1/YidC/SpoIIIJ
MCPALRCVSPTLQEIKKFLKKNRVNFAQNAGIQKIKPLYKGKEHHYLLSFFGSLLKKLVFFFFPSVFFSIQTMKMRCALLVFELLDGCPSSLRTWAFFS